MSEHESQPEAFTVDEDTLKAIGGGNAAIGRGRLRMMIADARAPLQHDGPVERPNTVRLATEQDEPAVLALLLEDLAANATTVAPPDNDSLLRHIRSGTRGKGAFVALVDDAEGVPAAVTIIQPTAWWWSQTLFLQELVLYVSARAPRAAASDLLRFECWLSDQMTEVHGERIFVLAGVTGAHRWESKLRLYRRHMNPVGGFCIYPSIPGLDL